MYCDAVDVRKDIRPVKSFISAGFCGQNIADLALTVATAENGWVICRIEDTVL